MSNIFVEKMKKIVSEFYKQKQSAEQEKKHNISTFIDSDKKNAEIDNKIRTDYATALQSVKSVFEEVRKLLSRADCPNSEEIICADMGLFSSFPITPNDVEYLITNHSTDYTFLNLNYSCTS